MTKLAFCLWAAVSLVAFCTFEARGQADFGLFTFQGNLNEGGVPANGNYELTFEFFNAPVNGTSLGSNTFSSVAVSNGIFTVDMTGSTGLFAPGAAVWIQISARPAGSPDAPTILTPRQRVQSAPMAISSLLSADSQRLGGIEANQFITTTTGATTFIQNGTTQQTGGFNLNGTGTANVLNAASQFNINGSRILSAGGADNIFAGFQAGQSNTSGASNSFFGVLAGSSNTTGNFNSFFGRSTGTTNSGGNANSFFGSGAGNSNSTGGNNSFFGADAGSSNTVGNNNTLLGVGANVASGNLTNATALGFRALVSQSNSLVLGGVNGINGANADTNVGIGLTNPTQRLQVVGNAVFSGNLGVGTAAPNFKFELIDSSNTGLRVQTNGAGGTVASFGGFGAFRVDAPGSTGGRFTILENGNVGIGYTNPTEKLSVFGSGNFLGNLSSSGNGFFGGNLGIGVSNPTNKLQVSGNGLFTGNLTVNGGLNYFDTVGNANFFMKSAGAANGINFGVAANAGSNSTLYISQYDGTTFQDRLTIDANGNVGLGVFRTDKLAVNGTISVLFLGNGGSQPLCRNFPDQISTCSSSLRYKTNIGGFTQGMSFVDQFRPISFDWKDSGMKDIGFGAEDVEKIDPRFVIYNDKGEVEGLKYDRLSVVFVNAFKEQQKQIEAQQKQIDEQTDLVSQQKEKLEAQQREIERQRNELEGLKKLICGQNPKAALCQPKK